MTACEHDGEPRRRCVFCGAAACRACRELHWCDDRQRADEDFRSGPTHWLKARGDRGALKVLTSVHRDNPKFVDRAKLDALTGVRRLRLLEWIVPEDSDFWPCPEGCGGGTEDEAGGPCNACWRRIVANDRGAQ